MAGIDCDSSAIEIADEDTFVQVGADIGKLISINGATAEVQFFDAPVAEGTICLSVPIEQVRRKVLERQTRVWWDDGGQWRVGRVLEPPDENTPAYLIGLYEQQNADLTPDQFYVRWSRPLEDPVRLLESKCADARFLYRSRSAFIRAVLDHRAAAQELVGISSSGIRLHQHQVVAARRVLTDPVRRYLLADEVGLGKTIEAGMVMRQLMLESANTRGLVLVPSPLVGQWEREISDKFDLQGLCGGWVDVEAHDAAPKFVEDSGVPISFLVVDEAHGLAEPGSDSAIYDAVERIAAEVPSLLLLSATPVRSNEEPFLRLLHLLDPMTYDLSDLEGFRQRIERRDVIGNAVTLLGEDVPTFLMQDACSDLRSNFPEDELLLHLVSRLSAAIESDDGIVRGRAREVRNYVSDAYRVHRRLIRTRRNARLQAEFPVRRRRRSQAFRIVDQDPRRQGIVDALDRFRGRLAGQDDVRTGDLLRMVAARCSAATPAVRALHSALRSTDETDLLEWERPLVQELRANPLGDELAAWLDEALEEDAPDQRLEELTTWAWARVNKRKVAAFTSYTSVGRMAAERMRERYGNDRVAVLLSDMTDSDLEREYDRACNNELCLLLVCDSVAEEGWNLQFVGEVLHLDLPWSTNRLEQRLGRFDRYADGQVREPVLSTVFADPPPLDTLTGAWTRLLDEGFDVFCTSSATLQYALPDHEAKAVGRVVERGFRALNDELVEERAELEKLRRAIEGQDLLDAVEDSDEERRFFDRLIEVDGHASDLGQATSDWIGKALNVSSRWDRGALRFARDKRTTPLITETQLRAIGHGAFDRRYAVDRRDVGRAGVVPLRPGQALIDSTLDLGRIDGRGMAFAAELADAKIPSGQVFPIFLFDLLVEAGPHDGDPTNPSRQRASEARTAAHFAPRLESVWCMADGSEPPDSVRRRLETSETEGIGQSLKRFEELTAGMDWSATCRRAEAAANRIVRGRAGFAETIERARCSVDAEEGVVVAQLVARSRAVGETFSSDEVASRFERLRRAVSAPVTSTASCGVLFLVSM